MTATPKKLVHWALDVSFSDLGSPSVDTSSDFDNCTSSLQYVNSQLVAHGFTYTPGLSLEGLGKDETEKVVKCLLGMLSQRVDDMSRTEELTTKLRTLSYDHERMLSMYRTATEKAANAEREMNLHKSRLAATTKSLQASETAHKHTTAELQRTRTSLQSLRTAHAAEIKRIEKEKERMVDRWSKLSDGQLKIGSTGAGMTCTNLEVVEASDVQLRGKGEHFLEVGLAQTEQARKELFDQNRRFRGLILSTANDMQGVAHTGRCAVSTGDLEEPPLIMSTSLFPSTPVETAEEKLSSLLKSIKESVVQLSKALEVATAPQASNTASNSTEHKAQAAELERLQAVIATLRKELEQAQKDSATYAAKAQDLFDRFAADERLLKSHTANSPVGAMTSPEKDEERKRLEARFQELEEERRKFTEAAVRLGKEKAHLEAERIKFLEEKRSWQVEMMLADLPPTPGSSDAPAVPVAPITGLAPSQEHTEPAAEDPPPRRSPRKSPKKTKAERKARAARRSSGYVIGVVPVANTKPKVIPSFETEVIPSQPVQMPTFKTSISTAQPQPPTLPSAFVLPPPSPAASLPSQQGGPLMPPLPALDLGSESGSTQATGMTGSQSDSALSNGSGSSLSTGPSGDLGPSASAPNLGAAPPRTPSRSFPRAKTRAPHMMHAYSPATPSPLSRILMLADSPESPPDRLAALSEEDEGLDVSPTPAPDMHAVTARPGAPIRSLAEELGVSESDDEDENPLFDRKPVAKTVESRKTSGRPGSRSKDKAVAAAPALPQTRPLVMRKEDNALRPAASTSSRMKLARDDRIKPRTARSAKAAAVASTKPKVVSSKLPSGKGGARRVPINSAEAAQVLPAWKG
ncbi:hypothetical protein CERSUDRAFT_104554 [Gelatoporia subvermispora B]|uniref:Afadin and alpha-actinin-binding-domain-containing protein n=1 Tax=Ceriporiopsis subvermispora (strain B) TaxID=914234 RepID=M2RLK0_CERS8|nr:hypothetical protein CERSUDRAFT_104554 [Gelatoporia subvermispora B]